MYVYIALPLIGCVADVLLVQRHEISDILLAVLRITTAAYPFVPNVGPVGLLGTLIPLTSSAPNVALLLKLVMKSGVRLLYF